MVKRRPNGLARGPEAEPAVQPLIAQLKRAKADMTEKQDESFGLAYPELVQEIQNLVIRANSEFNVTSESFLLVVPVTHGHLGVTVTGQGIRKKIRDWATNNGLSITFSHRHLMESPGGWNHLLKSGNDSNERLKILEARARLPAYLLHAEPQMGSNRYQLWRFAQLKMQVRDQVDSFLSLFSFEQAGHRWNTSVPLECHRVEISWAEEGE